MKLCGRNGDTNVFVNVSSMSVAINECHVCEMNETRGPKRRLRKKCVETYENALSRDVIAS